MTECSAYATPSATREILDRFQHLPRKSFGQNFLINDEIIRKIIDLSGVGHEDVVLEVGPGIGTLSDALLKHAEHLIAVEYDRTLEEVLAYTLRSESERFSLINKDALDLTVDDLRSSYSTLPRLFISNLPYSVAATLVLKYFAEFDFIDSATVMVQKEVGNRIMSRPGTKDYGAYTVKLSLYADPISSFIVKPGNFLPKPHVDSMVIRLDRIEDASLPEEVLQLASIMADAAFANRRKTIVNSMRSYLSGKDLRLNARIRSDENAPVRWLDGSKLSQNIGDTLAHLGIDPKTRGEKLDKNAFIELGKAALPFTYLK